MTTLLPNFDDASFESGQPIDNRYFPLTPGTVFSYQGKLYDTEEIVEEVTEEIGEEISDELGEELDEVNNDEGDNISNELDDDDGDEDSDLDGLADDIEDEVEELVDDAVDDIVSELGDDVEAFDSEELAAEISEELTEDVIEELTGEEIELDSEDDEAADDFGDEIVETLDEDLDTIAIEIADEIEEAQADLFATESNQVFVSYDTKNILGVETTVVRDVAWDEGILVEDTLDWYAQDTEGNVWYLGEIATNYEYDDEGNFIGTNTEGSWEAGVDGALPGYLMPANPQVGDSYYQEFYPGEAEDKAEVISLNESVATDLGEYENVLKTREFNPLEPDVFEFKYFAPEVGQILAEEDITEEGGEPELSPELVGISEIPNITLPTLSTTTYEDSAVIDNPYFTLTPGTISFYEESFDVTDDGIERHEVTVTEDTKDILGVSSLIVKDSEFDCEGCSRSESISNRSDDVLTDEKLSYYAQDGKGNVWLLGETVTEYKYDEAGNLIDTDDSESWLAGEGQALPGLIMTANPEVGEAYYQRFDIGEAENQAEVIETNLSLDIGGETWENVVKIEDFSALEPEESDLKYYAPGVGLILEEELNADGEVIFTSSLQETADLENDPFIDLLDAEATTVRIYAMKNAAFDNVGGFYKAIDAEGTVVDPVTGDEIAVGDVDYETTALASSVAEFSRTSEETLELDSGFVYVPYLLANGETFLTGFAEANVDGLNHVQTNGKQNFGFEDLIGGGDNDFNDFTISVETV